MILALLHGNHPIDIHFTCANIKGWPRLIMQVWELDSYGRAVLTGYGFTHLPSTPGKLYKKACWLKEIYCMHRTVIISEYFFHIQVNTT